MPSTDDKCRSKPREQANDGRFRRNLSSTRPREPSPRPRELRPTGPSKRQETKEGGDEKKLTSRRRRQSRKSASCTNIGSGGRSGRIPPPPPPPPPTGDGIESLVVEADGAPSRSRPSRRSTMSNNNDNSKKNSTRGDAKSSSTRSKSQHERISYDSSPRREKKSSSMRSKSQQRHINHNSSLRRGEKSSSMRSKSQHRHISHNYSLRRGEKSSSMRSKSQHRHNNHNYSPRRGEKSSSRRSESQHRHNSHNYSPRRGAKSSSRRSKSQHKRISQNSSPSEGVESSIMRSSRHRLTNHISSPRGGAESSTTRSKSQPRHIGYDSRAKNKIGASERGIGNKDSESVPNLARSAGHGTSIDQRSIDKDHRNRASSLQQGQGRNYPIQSNSNTSKNHTPRKFSAAADEVDRLLARQFHNQSAANAQTSTSVGASSSARSSASVISTASICSKNSKDTKMKATKKTVGKLLSKISRRARSRSRDRSRSKQEIDPWSDEPAGDGSDKKQNLGPSSKYTVKSSMGSGSSSLRGNSKSICSGSVSVASSKMGCSTTPTPRLPQHRSMSISSVASAPIENNRNGIHHAKSITPAVVISKNRENSSRRSSVPPPPRTHSKIGRRSAPDLSSSSNTLLHYISPPPPPPSRMSKFSPLKDIGQLSTPFKPSPTSSKSANGNIRTSSASVSVTTPKNAADPATFMPKVSCSSMHKRLSLKDRDGKVRPVSSMEYTDPYGDCGIYSGEVDDESRPHGKGKMKYDNGIFYDGKWIHGCKDETRGTFSGDQTSNVTRERILSGFTSWKGQTNREPGCSDKGTFVYGMAWVDLSGMAGKYTGHVSVDDIPDGKGVMRYEFGLVAEGEWIRGKLNDGAGGGMSNGVVAQSVAGGMTVAPAGMSVAGGAATVVSGLGMMSIGGTGGRMMMGSHPNGMMNLQYMNAAMQSRPLLNYHPAGMTMGVAHTTTNYEHQQGIMNYPSAGGAASVPTDIVAGRKR